MDLLRILYGDYIKFVEELGLVKEKQKNKNDIRFFLFIFLSGWMVEIFIKIGQGLEKGGRS